MNAGRALGAIGLVLGGAAWLGACGPPETRPASRDFDVVLIVIDTLRADHLPFYGYPKITAPYLSELASAGIVFRHAHSSSSWTAPATASLFTSLHPFQHGVVTGLHSADKLEIELNRIADEVETVGELFRSHGYRTFAVSDNPNICEAEGFEQGFDYFESYDYAGAPAVNAMVLDWADEIEAAQGYFLYLHYMDPHVPYHEREPWFRPPTPPVQRKVAAYDSEIGYVDAHIRELGERLGWDEGTLLIVVSDHGEEFGDHGGRLHGVTLYREVLDVPLLFYAPALLGGPKSVDGRVSILDVVPTLAELIGAPRIEQYEGESLVPLLRDAGSAADRLLYAHLHRRRPDIAGPFGPLDLRSVIRGDWKLVTSDRRPDQLFQLALDPLEQSSRTADEPEVARALGAALLELESSAPVRTGEKIVLTLTPEERERLRSLGYVD